MSRFVQGKKLLFFSAAFSLWVILWDWYQNIILSYFYGKNPWASSFLIKLAWCQANVKHWIFDSVFSIVLIALGEGGREGGNLMVLLRALQHWHCCERHWGNISLCLSASMKENLFDTIEGFHFSIHQFQQWINTCTPGLIVHSHSIPHPLSL